MEVREKKESLTAVPIIVPGSRTDHWTNVSEPLYDWMHVTVTLSLGQVAFTLLVRLENPGVKKQLVRKLYWLLMNVNLTCWKKY